MQILKTRHFWSACVLTLLCSVAGSYLKLLPGLNLIGALVIALLLGMLLQMVPGIKQECASSVGFISNKFLRLGIILLGFKLNLVELASHGVKLLLLAAVVVAVVIVVNFLLLKYVFPVPDDLNLLTASGCGICGAAAIMGISPSVKASKDDTVLAVAVICIMGTIFTLIEVGLYNAHLLQLTADQYGVMSGFSLHEIAHAVAAGNAGGAEAEKIAVLAKLSRVLMLVPVAFILGILCRKRRGEDETDAEFAKHKLPIPWFMLGFLITSALGSYVKELAPVVPYLVDLAYIVLGMAMAALGLNVNFRVIKERGGKVMVGAFCGSVVQLLFCLGLALLFFK